LSEPIAGVILAAGLGTRLHPLTALRPKALCPLGQETLLEHALQRLAAVGLHGPDNVAVNAHAHAGEVASAVAGRATVSIEPSLLGTAGAVGRLATWLGPRPAIVTNVDAYLDGAIEPLLDGWSGDVLRLLVSPVAGQGDFGPWRFAGCSLLPARLRRGLAAAPAGLYEAVWRREIESGRAELIPYDGMFIDCGTPAEYLRANLHQSGGQTVVGARSVVAGTARRCLIWPDSVVGPGEHLVEVNRAGPLTVDPARHPSGAQQPS
jgi:NDP-sugar pyrophosphorylase family protein